MTDITLPDCVIPESPDPCAGYLEVQAHRNRLISVNFDLWAALRALRDAVDYENISMPYDVTALVDAAIKRAEEKDEEAL